MKRFIPRQLIKNNFSVFLSVVFLSLLVILALLTPLLPLQSPRAIHLASQLAPPTLTLGNHQWTRDDYSDLGFLDQKLLNFRENIFGSFQIDSWLGTDSKGRDILSRILWGSRVSLFVGLLATLISLLIGVSYGCCAGFIGGRLDSSMMRLVDTLYSLPFIFVVIFLLTLLNEYRVELNQIGIGRMQVFYLTIGLIYWLTMARVVRGQVLALKQSDFIAAARANGASTLRIIRRHVIPNVLPYVVVYLTLTIPQVILFEAFLSFLGLGVEAPNVSWGLLAVDSLEAINPIRSYWWITCFPSLAIGLTLLACNRLGDGLRDMLDPKLVQR